MKNCARSFLALRLVLSAALLCLTYGCGHQTANNAPNAVPLLVATGTLTKSEDTRIDALRARAITTPLTVSDVNWLLSMAYRRSPSAYLQGAKLDKVAHVFVEAGSTRLPVSRRGQVLAFAASEISFWQNYHPVVMGTHLVRLENVPMGASLILKGLATEAALVQIRPLLTSSNADVRQFAQEVLARPGT